MEACLFSILASRQWEFLLRGVYVHISVFVTYFFLLAMVSLAPLRSSVLVNLRVDGI